MEQGGCVYIMTNVRHSVFYTGVTSDIIGRVYKHKCNAYPNSFTARYHCYKLVYYFAYFRIEEAIAAEKLIKGGSRQNKIQLINKLNPEWNDLYEEIIKQ
ncbi:GIY-YIG nuclease family protein [Mucilaginibacter daejeonensis]|uniref:GIY-YIG nuclease family protein n=1 Tax=Mucilaginibacter daejeonensis TaxID=398049 RepID=UPI0021D45BF2|nr:GIY-YIG nuclease family protein [Mucilaginibacter daejeonensis]